MAKKSIPDEVKAQVATIIEQFNQEVGQQYMAKYVPRYRGNHLYLDRVDFMGNQGQICRLTYTGDLNSWEFAIYKYSDNRYAPDEWMIPGIGNFDGTVFRGDESWSRSISTMTKVPSAEFELIGSSLTGALSLDSHIRINKQCQSMALHYVMT